MNEDLMTQTIKICQRLIRAKSYSGQEQKIADELEKIFKEYGFDSVKKDEYGNVIACIKGNSPGKNILMDAHIDTVEVTDSYKWKYNPFGGDILNNRIYGRGTTDMKGALAAMITAAVSFRDKTNKKFKGNIYISGTVHEECFEGIAAAQVAKEVKPDIVIIGEATELEIACGQRGRAEIIVETYGKSAHSSNPEVGVNAVYKMMELIKEIQKIEQKENEYLGKSVLELTDIISTPFPGASVVPNKCRATFDRRTLIGETKESVINPIQQVIEKKIKEDSSFDAKAFISEGKAKCYTGKTIQGERFFDAWLFEKDDWHIKEASASLISAGMSGNIRTYSFCTNGSFFAGKADVKTLGFGPSKESLAHVVDEYIEIEQLIGAFIGYKAIIDALVI